MTQHLTSHARKELPTSPVSFFTTHTLKQACKHCNPPCAIPHTDVTISNLHVPIWVPRVPLSSICM